MCWWRSSIRGSVSNSARAAMTLRLPAFRLNPITRKKLRRFRQIRRGYVSFLIL